MEVILSQTHVRGEKGEDGGRGREGGRECLVRITDKWSKKINILFPSNMWQSYKLAWSFDGSQSKREMTVKRGSFFHSYKGRREKKRSLKGKLNSTAILRFISSRLLFFTHTHNFFSEIFETKTHINHITHWRQSR